MVSREEGVGAPRGGEDAARGVGAAGYAVVVTAVTTS